MGRILGLVNGVWATAQERKMHAIRQRFNLYAGGSLSADVRRFFQLINADEVLGTHRGLFQMAVDMRPLTREELVRSLPRELERLARSLLGRLRTERPPLGAPPSSSHRSMDLALSLGVSGGLECLSAIIPCSCLRASLSRKRRRAFSPALAAHCWVG